MRKFLLSIIALTSLCTLSLSAKEDYAERYNYKRAMEFWRKDDAKCMEWLKKEVEECPQNPWSYYRLSALYRNAKEYGQALTASTKAIETFKKDKYWQAYSYMERAVVECCLSDTAAALTDYAAAIALQPKEIDFYENRGDLLYEQKRYDEAASDFNKCIELKPGEAYGYMALGRNATAQEDYDEAIRQFTYCTKLSSSYASAYSFRAEAYAKQRKWREAVDDLLTTLQLDASDSKAAHTLETLADSSYTLLNIRLKALHKKDQANVFWPLLLAEVNNHTEHYAEGVKYNQIAFDISGSAYAARALATSHSMLGDYAKSIEMMDRACDIDTTDLHNVLIRAQIKEEAQMYEAALVDYDRYIDALPDEAQGYQAKASCLEHMDSIDAALAALELALAHDADNPQANLLEGKLLQLKGDSASAIPFFETAIAKDESRNRTATLYSYYYMQRFDSLDAVQKRLLDKDLDHPNNSNLYNVACLYALRGDSAQAMSYLRQSFEAGFVSFNHARHDRDFRTLWDETDFQNLIADYESRFAASQGIQVAAPATDAIMEGDVVEIPFTKEGGVCKVKCTINDLPLYFIFDTGASDVTMSTVEATFMFKNEYLSRRDITGREYYQTATGEISEGTTILLRTVNFGGVTLTNVKASVVASQNAPLLLGQSVLSRLGHIEIDNTKKVIRIRK